MGTEHGQESTDDAGTPEVDDPADGDLSAAGNPPVIDGGSKFDEVLDHLGMAMSLVETATHALEAAENNMTCSAVGSEIATLQQAVVALRAVHEELDLAIEEVEP